MNILTLVATVAMAGPSAPQSTGRDAAIWSYARVRMQQQMDVWFDLGEFPKVIQVLRVEREVAPADYDVVTNLGWMLENVQDYDSARAEYRRYLKDNPNDSDAALPLAQQYFLKKEYTAVPELLEPFINRTPPPHPNVYRILANSYERMKKYGESVRVWKTYLKVAPDDLTAIKNLKKVEDKRKG